MLNGQLAQITPGGGSSGAITNPLLGALKTRTGLNIFQMLIPGLISIAFVIGVLVFFFVFLLGAIQYITSGGDKTSIEAARGKLGSALVGLIILFSTFAIIKVIETFFGISILVLDISLLKIR